MKTPVSLSRRLVSLPISPSGRSIFVSCLTLAGCTLVATLAAALSHPPFISWIPDQRISSGNFATQYFKIENFDSAVPLTVTVDTSNAAFLPTPTATPCTPQSDPNCVGGNNYKVTFDTPNPSADPPGTTVTIKAKAGSTGSMAYTSFTLWEDSAINPPSISNLPNRAVQRKSDGTAEYKTMFVIGDLDSAGMEDLCEEIPNGPDDCEQSSVDFDADSSNESLLDPEKIFVDLVQPEGFEAHEGPRSFLLTATTESTAPPGRATVTVYVTDKEGNVTTTSFVIRTVVNTNEEPTIKNEPVAETFLEQFTSETSKVHSFTVTGAANMNDLKITASSSNTNLVPNDLVNNLKITQPNSSGDGSIEIVPVTPLPSPSPGVPQASTITLSVIDDAYTRQTTFLYVLAPGDGAPENGGVATSFTRPSGVYSVNAGSDDHRPDDTFLTGEMHGDDLTWVTLDSADYETFFPTFFASFPLGQSLSLNLQEEPCDIGTTDTCEETNGQQPCLDFTPWCDTNKEGGQYGDCFGLDSSCANGDGVLRAVPWDSYLRERRDGFLQGLAEYLYTSGYIDKISVINVNLPGGETGIRNPIVHFNEMEGYTRERLLGAIQDELRTIQLYFPGIPVQIGFFQVIDCPPACQPSCDPECEEGQVWKWLYRDATTDENAFDDDGVHVVALFDEFDGVKRPRVSFFQETLAATRASSAPNYITPPDTTAYTFTPGLSFIPSFAYYPDPPSEDDLNDRYNNGITFQSNTTFSNPSMEDHGLKLIHTLNGSPNDALEAAFNNLLSEYLEVYIPDLDQANPLNGGDDPTLNAELWAGQLQSWHDYTAYLRGKAPLEAPAGLTVDRHSVGGQVVNTISWDGVFGATGYDVEGRTLGTESTEWLEITCPPGTTCDDDTDRGSQYAYQVRAKNDDHSTPWAHVAVFLSDGDEDGYVQNSNGTKTAFPSANEPGIRAGRGNTNVELRGFLSFDTSALDGTTVIGAKLRLFQTSNDTTALGPCKVDIRKGYFNGSANLEPNDFGANPTHSDVARVQPLGGAPSDWVEAEVSPLYLLDINNSTDFDGRTQFRLYFNEGTTNNTQERWNSGGTVNSNPSTPPQLIVRYTP